MRNFGLLAAFVLGLLACQRPAAAQTTVEYGAAGSASATATTATKTVGSSVGGVLGNLGKTLDRAHGEGQNVEPVTNVRPAAARQARRKRGAVKTVAAPPAVPPPAYQNAMGIERGMSCEEVTRRFGPPSMSFAGEQDSQTMSYVRKTGRVQVECQSGKVASAKKSYY